MRIRTFKYNDIFYIIDYGKNLLFFFLYKIDI